MSARLDYLAGGESGYTGAAPVWGSSTDAAIGSILNRLGEGVNRAIDVNVERYLSTRRPAPAPAPAPAPTVIAGFKLPEWAPLAGLALAALVVVAMVGKKG